jgi:hypothetical protein
MNIQTNLLFTNVAELQDDKAKLLDALKWLLDEYTEGLGIESEAATHAQQLIKKMEGNPWQA